MNLIVSILFIFLKYFSFIAESNAFLNYYNPSNMVEEIDENKEEEEQANNIKTKKN